MNQKRSGILIRYLNIVIDFFIAIFFTPFILRMLGEAEYGLYRIVQSFAGQLSVMSFGIATLVARNIVRYDTLKEREKKENFLGTAAVTSVLLAILVFAVGFVLSFGIEPLFDRTLSAGELSLAKKLYWILIANMAITILTDMATGILVGHEKFFAQNIFITIKQLCRILMIFILLNFGFGSLAIVCADFLLSFLLMIIEYFYGFLNLKERIKFYCFDKEELKISLTFSFAIFLQAIVNQVNQNLDSVILGALTSTETVTMYSVALSLFTMFNSITMVFGTVFVPKATKMITTGATGEQLTDLVIKPGRFALMVGNLIITGFIIFGKEFIGYWVGTQYDKAYLVAIILMIPGILPLIQNVTNAILDAMMKRLGRTIILFSMALINIIVSIILVTKIGYLGAAIGTAFSYIVGYIVFLNIHLKKVTGMNIIRMYKEIFSRIAITAVLCLAIGFSLHFWNSDSIIIMGIKILLYTGFYSIATYAFAMNNNEKAIVKEIVYNILPKRRKS